MLVLLRRFIVGFAVVSALDAPLGAPLGAQRVIQLDSALLAVVEEHKITRPLISSLGQHRFAGYASSAFRGVRTEGRGRRRGGIVRDRQSEYVERRTTQWSLGARGGPSARIVFEVQRRQHADDPFFVIGTAKVWPEDIREMSITTTARIVIDGDTAGAWTMEIVERAGREVPNGYEFRASATDSTRTVQIAYVNSEGLVSGAPREDRFGRQAHGYVVSEGGVAIAAVQYVGAGLRGMRDARAWMPALPDDAKGRLAIAALLAALLSAQEIWDYEVDG